MELDEIELLGLQAGDVITLPEFLGSCVIELMDEYRPGIWQVRHEGVEFLISAHVLRKT